MDNRTLTVLLEALESTVEAFVTIDEDHRVVFFNRAAEKIFGVPSEEVVGKDLNAILTPDCSEDHKAAVDRYLETKISRRIGHDTELAVTRKSGEKVPVSISFSVARIDGRTYFTAILRDVTESKALQEQVARSERLAALGALVAEVSHEIKNPLVIIGIIVRQLIDRGADDESLGKLRIIAGEVARMEKLFAELNEYYLPKAMDMEAFDVNGLVREACALSGPECDQREIRLTCSAAAGSLSVMGNRDKLKQVVLNLVQNALEAMGRGGNLSIQTARGNGVEIRIADDGPGIPEGIQSEIFEPFFSTKKKGSGLGLAISKRIMEAHPGGSLTVSSREGGGATFIIRLG